MLQLTNQKTNNLVWGLNPSLIFWTFSFKKNFFCRITISFNLRWQKQGLSAHPPIWNCCKISFNEKRDYDEEEICLKNLQRLQHFSKIKRANSSIQTKMHFHFISEFCNPCLLELNSEGETEAYVLDPENPFELNLNSNLQISLPFLFIAFYIQFT